MTRLTPETCAEAAVWLAARDSRLAALIARVGPCRIADDRRSGSPFGALVRAILSQQLSTKAADTIHRRVLALVGGASVLGPAALRALPESDLRAAGVSGQKVAYLRDLALHVEDGRLDLHGLDQQEDERVIESITAVRGLGRWSAEMFLMFHLHRPDVFPVADLGIVKGVERLLAMKRRPATRTMLRAAAPWRPYRTVASWYLWRLLES